MSDVRGTAVAGPGWGRPTPPPETDPDADHWLEQISSILRDRSGLGLDSFRGGCIRRRLLARQRVMRAETLRDYARILKAEPEEVDRLLSAVTIDVSGFLRNPTLFEKLRERVLPDLFAASAREGRRLLFWSAGCARGEEPYSLALVAEDVLAKQPGANGGAAPGYRILATDIDDSSLRAASDGLFDEEKIRPLGDSWRERFFESAGNGRLRVRPEFRGKVTFRHANLLEPAPVHSADLVLCRNVLIYMKLEVQERILENLQAALRRGGYLVLGRVERLLGHAREGFEITESGERIFRRM